MKKIGIIGCRARDSDHDLIVCIDRFFEIYEEGDVIVSGGCPKGGDYFAKLIHLAWGIPMITHEAKWREGGVYNRGAGFARNGLIARDSDVVLALVTVDRSRCKGTMDTVRKTERLGKTTMLDENEEEFDPENII